MFRSVFLALLIAFPAASYAGVPQALSHQGRVLDANGDPISGTQGMTFSIYADALGGSSLWTETHPNIVLQGGYYSVELGELSAFPETLFREDTRYLGVSIAGAVELAPRTHLLPVPVSFTTMGVERAVSPPVACDDGSHGGRMYFDTVVGQLYVCNGLRWSALGSSGGLGESPGGAATDCAHLASARPDAMSGTYWLDPDGASGSAAFEAYCDLGADPGWTLCTNFIDTTGNDLLANGRRDFAFGDSVEITNGTWINGTLSLSALDQSGTLDCIDLAAAIDATEMRFSCEGGGQSFESDAMMYADEGFSASGTVALGGYSVVRHAEWLWGGYGQVRWGLSTASAYSHCGGNSCGSNGMGFQDGPVMMEIIGGGSDGCSNGCDTGGDFDYTGGEEGATCNGVSMRGVTGDRYSGWIR